MQEYRKLPFDPDPASEALQVYVENGFKNIISRFPKTEAAKTAYLSLATLYLETGKIDQAIDISDTILEKYKDDLYLSSRAQFIKANSYEKDGDWDKALDELNKLKYRYMDTPFGMHVPLYIANYYRKNKYQKKAQDAYQNAISSYKNLKRNNKKGVMGYAASNMLIQAYMSSGRYEEAGKEIENILRDYPTQETCIQQLPRVDLVFEQKLQNPTKAIEIYTLIVKRIKDRKIIKLVEKRIKELER